MTVVSLHSDDPALAHPSPATMALKRATDILGAVVGLALLSPVLAVVAIIIKLDSRGPIFFRQIRVGRWGHFFRIIKFRSMKVEDAQPGTLLTVHKDKRVTRFGEFLRRSKLDELPQLLNVLAGDMSLVGPRPEVPQFIRFYTPQQRAIMLSVKPGITDYAALFFHDESSILSDPSRDPIEVYRCELMPIKFRYYERYIRQITILNDLRIILGTVMLLIVGRLPHWLGLTLDNEPRALLHTSEAKSSR